MLPRAELDRKRDAPALVNWSPWSRSASPAVAARFQIATRLRGVERATLEEDIGGVCDSRRVGKHLGDGVVEVRIGVAVFGRHRVRPEPGRRAAGGADRMQRCELRLAVEPVPGLAFPRRRALREHPRGVLLDALEERFGAERTRRRDGRQDAAARSVELLVASAAGAERELAHAAAAKRGMRMAVDQPGDGTEPGAVDFLDLPVDRCRSRIRPTASIASPRQRM